jgi:Asp-tRNA(Asn)/Glu-tRNA(Gln) amidotransferase A subunit family amidase
MRQVRVGARSGGSDLELALTVLAGTPPAAPRTDAGSVGVYDEDFLQPVAGDCRRAVRLAAEALADAGHELVDERPPRQEEIRRLVRPVGRYRVRRRARFADCGERG